MTVMRVCSICGTFYKKDGFCQNCKDIQQDDDIPDASNLHTFSFSCCKKCPYPDPTCHYTCGEYHWARDEHIRQMERNKISESIVKEMKKIKDTDIRWYGFNSVINLIKGMRVKE